VIFDAVIAQIMHQFYLFTLVPREFAFTITAFFGSVKIIEQKLHYNRERVRFSTYEL
jgi:hypothetical protein